VAHPDPRYPLNTQIQRFQGAGRIPQQIYFDRSAIRAGVAWSWRSRLNFNFGGR
jgi:hypothetical protein